MGMALEQALKMESVLVKYSDVMEVHKRQKRDEGDQVGRLQGVKLQNKLRSHNYSSK